jgi:hypothetical protein
MASRRRGVIHDNHDPRTETRTMPKTLLTILALLPTSILWGCGGLAIDDDDDDDAVDGYEVVVTFDGDTATVILDELETIDVDGTVSVALTEVADAAGVDAPEGYTYGFEAYDGYAMDGYTWDQVSQASLAQEAGDLQWPEELGMEGADSVNGVVSIELTPAS